MNGKPLILAVETSGRLGSVALARGESLLAKADLSGPMRHSAELFPAVGNLLSSASQKPNQIDHIYISVGPGSFTGLRIAVTLAKTMHLANAAKIVAVDTLDVIAANVTSPAADAAPRPGPDKIAAVLDAKRGRFFIAVYQRTAATQPEASPPRTQELVHEEIWKKTLPDSLMTASQFLEKLAAPPRPVWLLGEGLVHYQDKFKAENVRFLDEKYWIPTAANVHLLGWKKARAGQFADPVNLQPNYLRLPDVKVKQP